MKHSLTLALSLLLTLTLSAQKTTYIALGGGLSTYSFELKDLTPVPSVGVAWKFYEKDERGISFAPALLYEWRAQSTDIPGGKAWVRSHIFSIEAALQYRIPADLTFGLGYFHGISLYDESGIEIDGEKQKEKAEIGDDIGLKAHVGYDFGRVALQLTYKNGLLPVSQGTYSRSFYLHLLYSL